MNKIKGYRNAIGFSQKMMSDAIGVSEATYRNKENGKSVFNKKELEDIFLIFKNSGCQIKLEDLFF